MIINVDNDAMLGKDNDSIYTTKFYIMQKQINELQQENNQLSREVDMWNKKYNDMFDENKQLKDNWNKLRECLKDVMNSSEDDDRDFVETILDIIQELEQGRDNDE